MTPKIEINILLQISDIALRVRATTRSVTDSCLPLIVRRVEASVTKRVECILGQRVVDSSVLAIGGCDRNTVERNNLIRGDSVRRPIPIGLTKVLSDFDPMILIDRVSNGDVLGGLVEDLL